MKRMRFMLGLFIAALLVIALALPSAVLAEESAATTQVETSAEEATAESAEAAQVETSAEEATAESAAETEAGAEEEASGTAPGTEAETDGEQEATTGVNNTAPTADAGGPYTGDEGSAITLSGSATDPDSDNLTYAWDLDNDGTYETPGQNVSNTWPDNGVFKVVLKVTDDDGAEGTANTTVTVINVAPTADAGGPYTGYEGSAINLTASATDPGADNLTYAWDLDNDGTYETPGQNVSNTWPDNGSFTVGLSVTDDDGGVGIATCNVTVINVAPTADAGGPYTGYEGSAITLSGNATDPGADILTYAWDLDNDGTYETPGQNVSNTWPDDGDFTVGLRVTDDDAAEGTANTTVKVNNVPPTPNAGGPYSGDEGSAINLTASASDPGDDVLTYAWDLDNDGTYETPGQNVSHTWPDNGDFKVGLKVSDDNGAEGTANTTVTVSNVAPTANAGGPYSGDEGSAINLTASATDPGADNLTYAWDLDNNGTYETANQTVSKIWPDNGVFPVRLSVTDDDGGVGIATCNVTVINVAPSANAGGPYSCLEGSPITLTASATDPGDDVLTYAWDLDNDGTYETPGQNVSETWPDNGVFPVGLNVTDDDGGVGIATCNVTVINVAPRVVEINATLEPIAVRQACTAQAAFEDEGVRDTHTATLEWADGHMSEARVEEANGSGTAKGEHEYSAAGIYKVRVVVRDNEGAAHESTSSYVVVYDPDAGFVTGGGWIDSTEGAYTPDPTLTGKANFGFVSKYKKGADTPSGETEFQFRAADLNFHSTSYDWLVITGSDYARFKGTGTINGSGAYKFMLWAGDGAPDTFRIKIWEEDASGKETVIYDNGPDQAIGGGSIVVHA